MCSHSLLSLSLSLAISLSLSLSLSLSFSLSLPPPPAKVYLDPWIRTLWNLVFTAAPIVVYSILEQDIPERIVLENPGSFSLSLAHSLSHTHTLSLSSLPTNLSLFLGLYTEGQRSLSFNWLRFTLWIFYSLWDGLVSFFGVILTAYGLSEAVNIDGLNGDYYATSTTSYTIMCLVANLHLFIHTRYWNCLTHWIYWLTLISWFLFGAFYCTGVAIVLGGDALSLSLTLFLSQYSVSVFLSPSPHSLSSSSSLSFSHILS